MENQYRKALEYLIDRFEYEAKWSKDQSLKQPEGSIGQNYYKGEVNQAIRVRALVQEILANTDHLYDIGVYKP